MDKQQQKALDEENALKYKLRHEKLKQDKIKAKENFQKNLLAPGIKGNLITWVDKYKNGAVYEGSFGKEKCFEIKRGVLTFSLKTIHKELKTDSKTNSSTELLKLQIKANNILLGDKKFLLKFKPIP